MNTEISNTTEAEITAASAQVASLEELQPELEAALEKAKRDEEAAPNITARLKAHSAIAAAQSALEFQAKRMTEAVERLTGLKARKERERREEAIRTARRVFDEARRRLEAERTELEELIQAKATLVKDYSAAIIAAKQAANVQASFLSVGRNTKSDQEANRLIFSCLSELGFPEAAGDWASGFGSLESCVSALKGAKPSGVYPADLPALDVNR